MNYPPPADAKEWACPVCGCDMLFGCPCEKKVVAPTVEPIVTPTPVTEEPAATIYTMTLADLERTERLVRRLLDHLECEYINPEIAHVYRELRHWVGHTVDYPRGADQ